MHKLYNADRPQAIDAPSDTEQVRDPAWRRAPRSGAFTSLRTAWRFCEQNGMLVIVPLLLFLIGYAPFLNRQDFDYDEGLNLMKALLYARNYPLYSEIWSDQPPLMTALLSWWFRAVGSSVLAARVLVILLSCLLIWALYRAIRLHASAWAATAAVVLLVLSEEYVRLSTSVMIGLPALALAVVAAYLLMAAHQYRRVWLFIASGVVMALALQIKLIALVVVPAMMGYVLLAPHTAERPGSSPTSFGRCIVALGYWTISLCATFLLVGLLFHALDVNMLLRAHLGEQTREAFLDAHNLAYLRGVYREHALYLIMAAAGLIWALRRGEWGPVFIPALWLLMATAALAYHKPIWHHHVTLLTIPLAWLCAFGVDAWLAGAQRLGARWRSPHAVYLRYGMAATGLLVLLGGALIYPDPVAFRIQDETYRNRPLYTPEVVARLRADVQAQPGWVFTDRPYYAFQANAAVPPPIAVLSRKRLESGQITEDMLIQVLETYRPRYIILERFRPLYGERLMQEVKDGYQLVFEKGQTQYYVMW